MQTFEVEVAAIQDIEGTSLGSDLVQDADIGAFSIGNLKFYRSSASRCLRKRPFYGPLTTPAP
jgi:hypothetical protein